MEKYESTIDKLSNQDLHDLKYACMNAVTYLKEHVHCCICEKCEMVYDIDFTYWNPVEDIGDTNDLFEIFATLGYFSLSYDSVLYTFTFEDEEMKVTADGLNIQQAVCNAFVELKDLYKVALDYERDNQDT